jgi:hypothetical protein
MPLISMRSGRYIECFGHEVGSIGRGIPVNMRMVGPACYSKKGDPPALRKRHFQAALFAGGNGLKLDLR